MASSSYRGLLATVKAELVAGKGAPQQLTELFRALDAFLPDFQSFLVFPGPRAEDRAQVANSPPTLLENQDIQTALRLSDNFNLNEVYCASLVISTLEKWNLHDRGNLEIMRVSAGLWFSERDSLITSLQFLLHAVALDKELDSDFITKIQVYIKKFLDSGLRPRLMNLIKELNEEGAIGTRDHDLEPLIIDSTGAVVERRAAIQKTRLSLCHCLYLSCLISPLNAQELKDLYNLLKLCSGDESLSRDATKLRITYTIMFSLSNALVSGAQETQQTGCMLALDASFCQEFQQLIMDASEFNAMIEGFTGIIRLAWVIIRNLNKQIPGVSAIGSTLEDDEIQYLCLNRAWDHDIFGFLNAQVFETAAFQNDEKVSAFKFTNSFCKLTTNLLSLPAGRQKVGQALGCHSKGTWQTSNTRVALMLHIRFDFWWFSNLPSPASRTVNRLLVNPIMELKYTSMMALDMRTDHLNDPDQCDNGQAQTVKVQAQPLVSFLYFAREIFRRGPELVINNSDLWNFVYFAGEGHTSYYTLVAFLDMLTALAECKEGAGKVYNLLQRPTISNLVWQKLFSSLVAYDQQLQLRMDSSKTSPPSFQEGDARVVEAYLKVLEKVIEKGDALERMQWFEDIEPLFKLLPRENVPPFLKGALRNAIAACASVSSVMKEKVCSLLEQFDLPVLATRLPTDGSGQHSTKQENDLTYELNEVEARQKEYLSTLSYLKLHNFLSGHELDTKSGRYFEIFQFVRDQVFGLYSQRLYANPVGKWELVVAALHHFEIILSNYELSDEDVRNKSDDVFASENCLPPISTSCAVKFRSATPAMELMKDLNNGGVIYSNLMSILMLGAKSVLEQRASQLYGPVLEEAVSLSFQIFIRAFLKESFYAESCHASHQSVHQIIFQDFHKVVTILEYVRYDKSQLIQRYSVKVMELFSARVPQLVSVLQEADAVLNLTEGYAACLEARFLEAHPPDNPDEDIGSLILRLLLVNLCKPPPNLTHLLLGFDVNQPVEKTTLQPNRYVSCLTVILHALDTLARPEVNAGLHELGFKLLYELCVDPITCGPMVDLLRNGKYDFLPKRTLQSSYDTCLERGNSSISGTDPYSSEAHDLELQTCDFEPAAGSAPEIPGINKPEVGFLNPEPLATRCTSKENDGPGEGSVAALRSSWIQRLFPGLLGESVKPSQWKGKEKYVAPDYENTERLLIENSAKVPEGFGSSPQLLGVVQDQGRESRHDNGRPGIRVDGSRKDLVYPCSTSSQPPPPFISRQGPSPAEELNFNRPHYDYPRQQDLYAHDLSFSQIREQETEKRKKVSSIHTLKSPADVDTRSMQGEHHPVQRHSFTVSNVARRSQQQEQNRHVSDGLGSSNKPALQTELPSPRFRKFELQEGGTRNSDYVDYSLTGRVGVEGTRVNDLNVGENKEHQAQYDADKGQNVVSLGSSPLPPLSLFAPFKHSKERRSALCEGKTNVAPGLSEDTPLITPLFSSRGYKNGTNDMQGGAGVPEDKFDSTMFAPYKPLPSLHPSTGMRDIGTPLTLTPIFAPFKTVEEHNRPSTSFIKTDRVPVGLVEQGGKDAVGQDIGMNSNVLLDAKAKQVEHRGQLRNQLATHGRSSSVYPRTPLPVVADRRKATMFSPNSVPRFNEGLCRVGTANVHEPIVNGGCRIVNTTAIELSSKRPSLQELRTDDGVRCGTNKDLSIAQSLGVQLSVSQGMRDLFQFDQDLQRQRLNGEAETVRESRPFSNLVCEPSSGSSPVPGGAVSCQQDGLKIGRASSSGVKGKITLEGPSALMKDAERDQLATDKETRGGTASFNVMAQSSEGLLSRRKPMPGMEGPGFTQGNNFCGEPENVKLSINAQEDKPGRSSRKRSHDARTSDSQFAAQNSEPILLVVPQNQPSVEDDSRTTPRSQSWLQRWMPSSKPAATVFKAPQSCGSIPPGQSSSHAKNRRLVQDSIVDGEQVDEAGSHVQEQHTTSAMQTANPWAGSNSNNPHINANPLFPGFYPVPSAAAMALVGAASRRAVPLPPQRVGTRISVWPAIAGIQLRRTGSNPPEVYTPQVEVEVVVEEG